MSEIYTSIASTIAQSTNFLGNLSATSDPKNEVSLIVGTEKITGWTRMRVTRSIERIPNTFEIEFTEKNPGGNSIVTALPGAPCQLKIGDDNIVTGYVDLYTPSFSSDSHTVKLVGRGKCQDLIDGAADWPSGQISGTNAYNLAEDLAKPFGIDVLLYVVDVGQNADQALSSLPEIPQHNIMLSESVVDILEKICRYSVLLYYEDADGNLVLNRSAFKESTSGFQEGVNIQEASASFGMNQRFVQYEVYLQNARYYADIPSDDPSGLNGIYKTFDKEGFLPRADGQPRKRKKVIVCESGGGASNYIVGPLRAEWENARRYGRAFRVDLVTDNWRNSEGKILEPGMKIPLDIPSLKVNKKQYVISEITYSLTEEAGTTAHLTLYPPDAFIIEPKITFPLPLREIGDPLHVPGGIKNPADTALTLPDTSPAVSPADGEDFLTTITAGSAKAAVK
jgi:prophage tail gpP-like protein